MYIAGPMTWASWGKQGDWRLPYVMFSVIKLATAHGVIAPNELCNGDLRDHAHSWKLHVHMRLANVCIGVHTRCI